MGRLLLERDAATHLFGVGPWIDLPQTDHYGDEENQKQRQRPRRSFEHTANHHAPGAASQMLQHQKRQATESDANPEDESHQVSVKELRAIYERAEDQQSGQHHTRN